jgi:hypothetical protein
VSSYAIESTHTHTLSHTHLFENGEARNFVVQGGALRRVVQTQSVKVVCVLVCLVQLCLQLKQAPMQCRVVQRAAPWLRVRVGLAPPHLSSVAPEALTLPPLILQRRLCPCQCCLFVCDASV